MPAEPSSARLSNAFARRTFPVVAAVMVMLLLATAGLLVADALRQDRETRDRSVFYARSAIDALRERHASVTLDYAVWGDIFRYLHLTTNRQWAYEEGNVGANVYERFKIDGVFVVDPGNRTTYAVIEGELSDVQAGDWLSGDLQALVERARAPEQDGKAVTAILRVGDKPGFVSAAEMQPDGIRELEGFPGPASVLVFVDVVDNDFLGPFGETLALDRLRLPRDAADAAAEPHLPLSEDGQVRLRWDTHEAGRELLETVMPLFAMAALMLAGLIFVVFRHALAAARLMEANEERFRDIAESATDWLWEVDEEQRITYLSARFGEVTGQAPAQWIGQPLKRLVQGVDGALGDWLASLQGDGRHSLTCTYLTREGQRRTCRLTGRPILHGVCVAGGYRGTANDITDEIEARARIEHMARHDPLTGLANRNRLEDCLRRLATPALSTGSFAVLCLDLDRFKPVNDALGHSAGDFVLREVAYRLQQRLRDTDLVARVGGDEFVMVLTGQDEQHRVEQICARLVAELAEPIQYGNQEIHIGCSIGIALFPHDGRAPEDLVRFADIALYEAKSAGRNTWRFYAAEMNAQIAARRQLEQALRQAIREGELRLYFQPRYQLDSLRLVSVEALVRWEHPERGLLLPEAFIPLAEETGLIVPLGQWVLEQACREAVGWAEPVPVSVNLSPRQFSHPALVADIERTLRSTGLDGRRLELELTETVMVNDADGALAIMNALKELGVRLSMDDFGTGFSSLSYLRSFPFDGLKIDRSFIAGMLERPNDRSIVQAIISLGRSLGMAVTAEGVETADQLDLLRGDACDEVQGFHLSRPMPATALHACLQPSDATAVPC